MDRSKRIGTTAGAFCPRLGDEIVGCPITESARRFGLENRHASGGIFMHVQRNFPGVRRAPVTFMARQLWRACHAGGPQEKLVVSGASLGSYATHRGQVFYVSILLDFLNRLG